MYRMCICNTVIIVLRDLLLCGVAVAIVLLCCNAASTTLQLVMLS